MADDTRADSGLDAATKALHAITLKVPCPEDREIAAAVLEAAGFADTFEAYEQGRADERAKLAGLARRVLDGDTAAFAELATLLDDALVGDTDG